jgi:putative membrane-bound dehydrogenase-like protein
VSKKKRKDIRRSWAILSQWMRLRSVFCLARFVGGLPKGTIAAVATFVVSSVSLSVNGTEEVTIEPHRFTIQDGYEIVQVAAPSLVKRPMHMCFDNEGVLYVTDSSGNTDKAPVQLKDPQHRVLRLVDRDGDGIFDGSTVFADSLPLPEGILVHDGSVYVGAPPHIWKLHDSTGDHVADERSVWFDGGSIENCGNDMHGPYYGTDGFFYWCKGAFAPQQHQLTNGRTRTSRAAHIYRALPDGSQLERVITGGMNNPVGLAFSDTGERFLSGTFFDLSAPGRRDGVLHAVYGGVYGRKNPRVLAPHPATGDLLPVLSHLGPAAPSGIVMPQSDATGLRGDLICTEFNTRRLSRHQLSHAGSSFDAKVSTFLESDQTDFHPTDVIEDADGSLLVADTGSWYKICCPTSKIAKPDILGAIYRVKKKDVAQVDDPRGLALDWKNPRVEWLSDKRPAVVRRAVECLAAEENIELLCLSPARVSAIWALHRIPGRYARDVVRQFIKSADSTVRIAAIQSVALWRDKNAVDSLIDVLSRVDDPHVLRVAAMALGRIGQAQATVPLLECYSAAMDPFLKHAITYAIYEIGDQHSLSPKHSVTKRVQRMLKLDRTTIRSAKYPEIEFVQADKPDSEAVARQKEQLDTLAAFLPQGDSQRGEKLFHNREKAKCVTCHLKGSEGVRLGPDLTRIGAIRSERDLLEAIVLPSASIARYHETVNVMTKDGKVVSGLLVKENTNAMFLASAEGAMQAVSYTDIDRASYSNVSLMPEGYEKILTPNEIADIVVYLKADVSRPAGSSQPTGE